MQTAAAFQESTRYNAIENDSNSIRTEYDFEQVVASSAATAQNDCLIIREKEVKFYNKQYTCKLASVKPGLKIFQYINNK